MGLSRGGLQTSDGPGTSLLPGATGPSLTLSPSGTLVGWIGDSISLPGTGNAPAQYMSDTRNVKNWAVDSTLWTTNAIPLQYTNNVTNQNRVVCAGGVNDITGGVAGATLAATVLAFADARLAEGKQVVLNTIGPFKTNALWTAGRQVETDVYNALILAAPATRTNVVAVDLFTLWESPPGSDTLNPIYDSGDGKHENLLGGGVWAAQMAVQSP